jgi:hypothetical protein
MHYTWERRVGDQDAVGGAPLSTLRNRPSSQAERTLPLGTRSANRNSAPARSQIRRFALGRVVVQDRRFSSRQAERLSLPLIRRLVFMAGRGACGPGSSYGRWFRHGRQLGDRVRAADPPGRHRAWHDRSNRPVPLFAGTGPHLAGHCAAAAVRYLGLLVPGASLSVTGCGPSPARLLPSTVRVTAPGLPSCRVTARRSVQVSEVPGPRMPA